MGNINNCFRKRKVIVNKSEVCVQSTDPALIVLSAEVDLASLQRQSTTIHHIVDVLDHIQVKAHQIEDNIDKQIKLVSPVVTHRRIKSILKE